MTRKKSKFLTFCFSLFPGAGEMYLGFFKQGISLMVIFLLLYIIGGIFLSPLVTFCTVVWFYSFFHTNNLNSLPDDEFYAIQDDFLIHSSQLAAIKRILLGRHRKLTAIILIVLGFSIIWNNVNDFLLYIAYDVWDISGEFMKLITHFSAQLPQNIVAGIIILAGIFLIRSKKRELDS